MSELRYTLVANATLLQEIKKSRFIAHAAHVSTPDAALAFLEQIRASDATHHCWAYRVGQQYRFNDDGEPSGTAGKPILAAIDGQQLDDVVVVIIRYFGGIKLGAGGLMRAYGGCAAECLRLAPKTAIVDKIEVMISCDFHALALIQSRLREMQVETFAEDFGSDGVRLHLQLPSERLDAVRNLLSDITRGRGTLRQL
ncbi:YigZ family protein [Pseudolysobacter antarcticus]|uniref:YigZ family protein n=1 Tax=Pseudolysobacter antarcticus TaxID=2511995 RepID=A0A411HJJ4_9GAMM|nr:YigZ family protein [Pseudolysobacter antarcticus]QBB70570.1 YigZ family protein [Pseudolysobacter antarcticus]